MNEMVSFPNPSLSLSHSLWFGLPSSPILLFFLLQESSTITSFPLSLSLLSLVCLHFFPILLFPSFSLKNHHSISIRTVSEVLIATVTFAASISSPGGVLQEGPSVGKSSVGKTRSFKLFIISNTLSLFLSLAIVSILVSVIPFQEESMRRQLVVTHKLMWAAVSFMVVAYIAAMWVIMPDDGGSRWVRVALLVIAAGTAGTVFVGLGVMVFTHWAKKTEWRKKKRASRRKETSEHYMQDRTDSDLDSSQMSGYISTHKYSIL